MIETDAGLTPFEVDDLDADTLLWLLGDAEQQDRSAGRRKLRYAAHWCVLHPGTEDDHSTWGEGERGPVADLGLPLGGEGTPLVARGAAEELAAALGVSTGSGQCLMADVLDLEHRLRGIWARVDALEVPAWKGRKVASMTRSLPAVGAAWVDAELADRLDKIGFPTIEKVVRQAIATWRPDLLAEKEKRGKASWGVRLDHPEPGEWAGTSWLDAAGDTADLIAFHDLLRGSPSGCGATVTRTATTSGWPRPWA